MRSHAYKHVDILHACIQLMLEPETVDVHLDVFEQCSLRTKLLSIKFSDKTSGVPRQITRCAIFAQADRLMCCSS